MIGRNEHLESWLDRDARTAEAWSGDGVAINKEGHYWSLSYHAKEVHLKDCKGVRYVVFLLENPNTPFLALHLVMHDSGNLPEPNSDYSTMNREQLAEEGLDSVGFPEYQVEKARSSVSHAVNRVMNGLKDKHPTLYDHLRASILLGRQVSYRPNWTTASNH